MMVRPMSRLPALSAGNRARSATVGPWAPELRTIHNATAAPVASAVTASRTGFGQQVAVHPARTVHTASSAAAAVYQDISATPLGVRRCQHRRAHRPTPPV